MAINIYRNISKLGLHMAVARITIMPCVETIALLVTQDNVTNRWLRDVHEQPLSSYQPLMLDD